MKNNDIFCVETITSKTNSTIVKIAKLLDKKYRKEESLFICSGVKLLEEAFKFNARIKYVIVNNDVTFEEKVIEIIKKIQGSKASILCVSESVFLKLTDEKAPQGIVFVCEYFSEKHKFSTIVKNCNSNEKVLEYIKKVITNEGVFAYNVAPYRNGKFSEATMSQLRYIKKSLF